MRDRQLATRIPLNLQFFADEPEPAPQQEPQNPQGATNQGGDSPESATSTQDDPDPTPEGLLAQIAKLKADNAKLKTDNDKLCTSEGNLRKQLRAKQTAEEAEAEAKAEQQAQHDEYVKGLERQIAISEAKNRYLEMGMDKELAENTATADVDGDREVVLANIQKYQSEWRKATEAAIRQEYLDQMPTPHSGNTGDVDFTQQFTDAMNEGDKTAAALALIQEAQANASAVAANT